MKQQQPQANLVKKEFAGETHTPFNNLINHTALNCLNKVQLVFFFLFAFCKHFQHMSRSRIKTVTFI